MMKKSLYFFLPALVAICSPAASLAQQQTLSVQQMVQLNCVMRQEQRGIDRETATEACNQLQGAVQSTLAQSAGNIYENANLMQSCLDAAEKAAAPTFGDNVVVAEFDNSIKNIPGCPGLFASAPSSGINADLQQTCFRIANRRYAVGEKLIPSVCIDVVKQFEAARRKKIEEYDACAMGWARGGELGALENHCGVTPKGYVPSKQVQEAMAAHKKACVASLLLSLLSRGRVNQPNAPNCQN